MSPMVFQGPDRQTDGQITVKGFPDARLAFAHTHTRRWRVAELQIGLQSAHTLRHKRVCVKRACVKNMTIGHRAEGRWLAAAAVAHDF